MSFQFLQLLLITKKVVYVFLVSSTLADHKEGSLCLFQYLQTLAEYKEGSLCLFQFLRTLADYKECSVCLLVY